MKNKCVKCLSVLFLMAIVNTAFAQSPANMVKPIVTADSLASGNSKEILTSFFQLAFNNLTGPNKEFSFTSNPFAIMLKNNPGLATDSFYYKYRPLRKLNFSFGIKLDTSFKFNGFSSAAKYAIIDKRDTTTSKMLFQNLRDDSLVNEAHQLNLKLANYAMDNIPDLKKRHEFIQEARIFFNKDTLFNKLDNAFQNAVKKIIREDSFSFPRISKIVNSKLPLNIVTEEHHVFDSLKNLIKTALLWTAGVSDTTYKDQFAFSSILLFTELLKGVGNAKAGSNWELDLKASVNYLKDTLISKRNLKRSVFRFEPGVNWIIRNKKNDQSILEFKFSGSYNHNFTRLYSNEKRDDITFNGTLRVRIISDIWVPLEFKYDRNTKNILGFLSVKANFSGLGKLLNSSSK